MRMLGNGIEVVPIEGRGWGVVANVELQKGDTIETCPVLELEFPFAKYRKLPWPLEMYVYNSNSGKAAVVLGFGAIYNHSNTANADTRFEMFDGRKVLTLTAKQKIDKGEEITHNYWGNNKALFTEFSLFTRSIIERRITQAEKDEILRGLREDTFCRLAPSTIQGVGVFAVRDIPKGTDPFRLCPQQKIIKISKARLDKLPPGVKKYVLDVCVEDGSYVHIPERGMPSVDVSYYLNHSTTPNMKTEDGYTFLTNRDVAVGEELTADYRTYCPDFLPDRLKEDK